MKNFCFYKFSTETIIASILETIIMLLNTSVAASGAVYL